MIVKFVYVQRKLSKCSWAVYRLQDKITTTTANSFFRLLPSSSISERHVTNQH